MHEKHPALDNIISLFAIVINYKANYFELVGVCSKTPLNNGSVLFNGIVSESSK